MTRRTPPCLSPVAGAEAPLRGPLAEVSIYDVAPTLLRFLGQPVPAGLVGRPLV